MTQEPTNARVVELLEQVIDELSASRQRESELIAALEKLNEQLSQ